MRTGLKVFLAAVIAVVLLAGAFSGGVLIGWALPGGETAAAQSLPILESGNETGQAATQTAPGSTEELFAPFWEAWDIVHDQYVDQPVDDVALMRGAIRGMLEALGDQHTSYMDPEEYEQSNSQLAGEYEGIGAWVDVTGDYVKIISPMSNSPAENAGLQPEDMVIAVDGEDMTGVDGNVVLTYILGPAGTDVTLTIQRGEEEPFDVTITRQKITMHAAEGRIIEDTNIAYIQITTFGDKTTPELRSELKRLLAENPDGLIIDLRNNGGGYLTTAIEVVSEFIPGGQIAMYEEFSDKSRRTFKTQGGGLATEIPLVVLVNEGTASASEITAGAIQDYERGVVVGVTTYGKGSVQNWVPLDDEQGAVRVTTARWLTPDERQIHEVGLEPDYVVEITEADVEADRDPQLDKAVELLENGEVTGQ